MKKDITYTQQVDKHNFPVDAPIAQGIVPPPVVPWQLGIQQKVQSKFVRTSGINIKHFVIPSNTGQASVGIINGQAAIFKTTLTANPPHQADLNFAMPFTSVWQKNGTVNFDNNFLIYPSLGGSIDPTKYNIWSGLDYEFSAFGFTINPDYSVYTVVVTNNTGGSITLNFFSQWKYLAYNNTVITGS